MSHTSSSEAIYVQIMFFLVARLWTEVWVKLQLLGQHDTAWSKRGSHSRTRDVNHASSVGKQHRACAMIPVDQWLHSLVGFLQCGTPERCSPCFACCEQKTESHRRLHQSVSAFLTYFLFLTQYFHVKEPLLSWKWLFSSVGFFLNPEDHAHFQSMGEQYQDIYSLHQLLDSSYCTVSRVYLSNPLCLCAPNVLSSCTFVQSGQ